MTDLSGDGLPNLAKFVLGLNPNVADNVLNLSSMTNGTPISGFAQLPIYGLSISIPKPPIALWVNGLPASDAVLAQGPDGQWQMDWNTIFLTNGNYQIQLDCPVAPASSPDSITNVMGAPITVLISNPITMDKLTSQFTSYLYIYGTLADTNDTYDVYLYDDYGNPLVYATGLSAPNGQIALGWDLTDGNGHQISFGNIQVFSISIHRRVRAACNPPVRRLLQFSPLGFSKILQTPAARLRSLGDGIPMVRSSMIMNLK